MNMTVYDQAFANLQAAADQMGGATAPFLKFIKGDYLLGQEDEEVPAGTKVAANVMGLQWGWVRWRAGRPEARQMVAAASGHVRALRDELGDLDQSLWDLDEQTGKPRDPWQPNYELPLREIEGEMRQMMFTGGSRGIEGAVADLLRNYTQQAPRHPGATAVVELRIGKYQHKNKAFGIIKVPQLPIVQWMGGEDLPPPTGVEDLDDEIPFAWIGALIAPALTLLSIGGLA